MNLDYFLNKSNYIENQFRNLHAEMHFLPIKQSNCENPEKIQEIKSKIQEELKCLSKEKSDLLNQAYKEKLFCVDIGELNKTFNKLCNDTLNLRSLSIKTYAYSKKVAVERAVKENPKVNLIIFSTEGNLKSQLIKMNFNDFSCSNEDLEKHFDFSDGVFSIIYPYSLLKLNSKGIDGLEINFHPASLKDEFFSRIVYECVKNKEKQQKIQENSQKNKEKQ